MASFTERIRLIFDVDSKGATTGFRGFASSVKQAEGLTGKMKAGVGSLSATLKANLATAAAAAGAALVAFGVQAVQAFTGAAKAAKDTAAATGLSTEEASRWIAVADDMEISTEQLTTGLAKVAKSLGGDQWSKYGIATRDGAGMVRDANDVILDAFDVLAKIPNATERAAVGNELFGKSYTNLSPLIGKTRDELVKWLDDVEDGQVITDEEAKKAEEMRLAWDELSDAIKELQLEFGKALTQLAPLLVGIAKLVTIVTKGIDPLFDFGVAIASIDWQDPIGGADKLRKSVYAAVHEMAAGEPEFSRSAQEIGLKLGALATKAEAVTDAVDDQKRAWQKLDKTLSDSSMFESTMLGLDDIRDELADIDKKVAEGSITWEEAGRLRTLAVNDQKSAVNRLIEEVLRLPPEAATEINVLIDQGKFDEAKAKLDSLKVVTTSVSAGISAVGAMSGPGAALGGAAGSVVNNIYVNAMVADGHTGQLIANALAAYYRNGGKRP